MQRVKSHAEANWCIFCCHCQLLCWTLSSAQFRSIYSWTRHYYIVTNCGSGHNWHFSFQLIARGACEAMTCDCVNQLLPAFASRGHSDSVILAHFPTNYLHGHSHKKNMFFLQLTLALYKAQLTGIVPTTCQFMRWKHSQCLMPCIAANPHKVFQQFQPINLPGIITR